MSYRGPNRERMMTQMNGSILPGAGQVMTWRQYISASAGVDVAGEGDTPFYRQQTITAVMGMGQMAMPNLPQHQTPAGQVVAGQFYIVTQAPIAKDDEIVWRGQTYRVESDPTPSVMVSGFVAQLKRGL